uniref:CUB domain-containing protein n=1 Tax=Panagrolaimus superbus TaxID=310955 RepID=A0A914Z9H3_9BILA
MQIFFRCVDDYLEIRDGPSESSPLIGKYCSMDPPSTIFSSDSSLYVRFVTDFDAKSPGFNATYEVASCGGSIVLQQGHTSAVTSPNYPEPYPQIATCAWNVHAPRGHFVEANIEHIWMSYSENCTMDYLMLKDKNETGDILMPPACSKLHANLDGYQSMHDSMFVEFHSNSSGNKMSRMFCSNRQCGFDLKVSSSPFGKRFFWDGIVFVEMTVTTIL